METEEDFRREIQAAPPDLILADYSLPRFGALGALAVLRELGCQVPLILVTGSTSEEIAVQCLRDGAEDYIIKSALKRLPGAVKKALMKGRAGEERRAAESALRRSEEQFRLITENTRDLVCLLDLDGRFLYASPSLASSRKGRRRAR